MTVATRRVTSLPDGKIAAHLRSSRESIFRTIPKYRTATPQQIENDIIQSESIRNSFRDYTTFPFTTIAFDSKNPIGFIDSHLSIETARGAESVEFDLHISEKKQGLVKKLVFDACNTMRTPNAHTYVIEGETHIGQLSRIGFDTVECSKLSGFFEQSQMARLSGAFDFNFDIFNSGLRIGISDISIRLANQQDIGAIVHFSTKLQKLLGRQEDLGGIEMAAKKTIACNSINFRDRLTKLFVVRRGVDNIGMVTCKLGYNFVAGSLELSFRDVFVNRNNGNKGILNNLLMASANAMYRCFYDPSYLSWNDSLMISFTTCRALKQYVIDTTPLTSSLDFISCQAKNIL